MQRTLGGAELRTHEFGGSHPDVAADLAQQGGRDIASRVHRHGGYPPVGVAELLVRAALADLDKPEPLDDLARLEDRDRAHGAPGLGDEDRLRADELRLEGGLPILQEHGDHLPQVGVELVKAVPLAVSAWEAGNVSDEDAGLRVALDDGRVSAHIR